MCLDKLCTKEESEKILESLPEEIPVWKVVFRGGPGQIIEACCQEPSPSPNGYLAGVYHAKEVDIRTFLSGEIYVSGFHCCLSEEDCLAWAGGLQLREWEWLRKGFIRKENITAVGEQMGVTVLVARTIEYRDEVLYRPKE